MHYDLLQLVLLKFYLIFSFSYFERIKTIISFKNDKNLKKIKKRTYKHKEFGYKLSSKGFLTVYSTLPSLFSEPGNNPSTIWCKVSIVLGIGVDLKLNELEFKGKSGKIEGKKFNSSIYNLRNDFPNESVDCLPKSVSSPQ